MVATAGIRVVQVLTDGEDVLWVEMRPNEGGRSVVVRRRGRGDVEELAPAPFSVRTRVHEYGGGACAARDGVVIASCDADTQLYRLQPGTPPVVLTATPGVRYADATIDVQRHRLICVAEDHRSDDARPENLLVSVPLAGDPPSDLTRIAQGHDFYSNPRLSPSGDRLCWLSWDDPDMPWDSTTLWTAPITADGGVGEATAVAGGAGISVFQPEWSPTGVLHYVADGTGWWNLYRRDHDREMAVTAVDAEFGMPQWVFGLRTYAFTRNGDIVAAAARNGVWSLLRIAAEGALEGVDTPFTEYNFISVAGDSVVAAAGAPNRAEAVVAIPLDGGEAVTLSTVEAADVDAAVYSLPESILFPTEGSRTAHAFFYAAHHPAVRTLSGELPPLLVLSHGGPTSAAASELDLRIQFWTSRGIGVVDVNYGGSTGFGRAYRERMNGQWGVVDVDDCIAAARYLVDRGDADAKRLAIAGGSAGGFTTLCALTFRDDMAAGLSRYGVADIAALAADTHKFEARYDHHLIGPSPEAERLYRERSPLFHADRLSCPVLLLQGLEDKVVPPAQAETMREAMVANGVPCAYITFEGEQHGFRRAETIVRATEAELSFLGQVFGFEPADDIPRVLIDNLH